MAREDLYGANMCYRPYQYVHGCSPDVLQEVEQPQQHRPNQSKCSCRAGCKKAKQRLFWSRTEVLIGWCLCMQADQRTSRTRTNVAPHSSSSTQARPEGTVTPTSTLQAHSDVFPHVFQWKLHDVNHALGTHSRTIPRRAAPPRNGKCTIKTHADASVIWSVVRSFHFWQLGHLETCGDLMWRQGGMIIERIVLVCKYFKEPSEHIL